MKKIKTAYYQQYDLPLSFSNKNFQKILNFYLFECPVPDISNRGKRFEDYGFRGTKAFGKLLKCMKSVATESFDKNYFPCIKEDLTAKFSLVESVSPPDEYCVFMKWDKDTVMQSLFAAIRHAFAHGSFSIKSYGGTRIYFFANFKKYKKAQIVLHENTLLSWIDLIQSGYSGISD